MSKRDGKEFDLEAAFSKAAKRLETKLMLLEFLNNKQVSELAKVKYSLNIYSETFPFLRLYDDEVPIHDDTLNNFTERIHELPVQMSFESNNSSKCNPNDSFSAFHMLASKLNVPKLASQQAEKHQKKGSEHLNSNAHVTTSSTQRNNTTRKGIESAETSLELPSATETAMSLASEANTSKQKQKSPNNSPTRSPTISLNRSPNNKKESNIVDLTLKSKQKSTPNGMQTSEIHLHKKSQQRSPVSKKSNHSEYNSNQKGTLKAQKRSSSPVLEDTIMNLGKSSPESNNKNRAKSAHIHVAEDNLRGIYSSKGSTSPKLNPKTENNQPQKGLFQERRKKEPDLPLSRGSSNHSESRKKSHEFSTPLASFRQTLPNQPSAVKEKDPKKNSTIRATTETREVKFQKKYKQRSSSLSKSPKSKEERVSSTASNQKKSKDTKSASSSPGNKIKKKQAQKKKALQISEKIHFPGPSQTPSPSFGGGRKITTSANETLGFKEDPIPYVRVDDQPETILSVLREKEIGFHGEVNHKIRNEEHVNQYRGFNQEKVFSLRREEVVVDNMDHLLQELMGDSFENYREPMYEDSPFVGVKSLEDTFSKLFGDSFGSHNVPQGDATLSSRPLSPTNKSDAEKNHEVRGKRRKENQRAKSENLNAPKNLNGKSFVFEDIAKVMEPEIKEQEALNRPISEDKSSKISASEEEKTDNETNQNVQIKASHLQEQSQASAASLVNGQKHQAKQKERNNHQKRQKTSQQENDPPEFLNSQSKNASNSTKELYLSTQQSRSHDVDKQAENLIDKVFANNQIVYPQTEPIECLSHQKFESLERAELVDLVESKGKLRKESIYHSEKVFSKRSSAATIESNNQNLLEDIEQGKINKLLDEFAGRSNTERVEEISARALEPCEQINTVKTDGDVELADQMQNIIIQENSSFSKLSNEKLNKQRKNDLKTFQRYSSTQSYAKSSNVSLETNSIPLSDYTSEPKKNKTKQSQKKSKTVPKKDKSARSSSKILTSSNKPLKKTNSKTSELVKSKKPKQKQPAAVIQVQSPKAWSIHNDSSSCIDINHINNNLERQQETLKQHINNKEGQLKVSTAGRPEIPILRTDKIRAQNSRSDKLTSVSNRSQKGQAVTSEFSLGLISNPEEHLQPQHEDEEEEKRCTENIEFPEISHIENIESEEQSASWYEEISLGLQRNPFSDIGSETRTQDLSNPKKLFTSEIMKEIEKGIEIEVPAEKNSISEKVNFAASSNMTDRSAACKSEIIKGWNSTQMNVDSKLGSYDSLAMRKYSVDGRLLPEKKTNAVNLDQYRSLNRSQRSSVKQTEESRSKGYEQALQDSSFENRAAGQIHVDGSKDGAADFVSEAGEGFESAGEEKIIKTPASLCKQEDQQKISSAFAGNSDEIGSSTSNQETDGGMKIKIPRPNKLSEPETEKTLENSKNANSDGKISSPEEYFKDNRQNKQSSVVAVEDHEKICLEKEKRETPLNLEGLQKLSGLHRDSGKSNIRLLQTNQSKYLGGDYNFQKLGDAIEQSEQNGGIQRPKDLNVEKNSEILPTFQVNSLAESKETVDCSINVNSVRKQDKHAQNPPKMSNQSIVNINQTVKISKSTQATPDKVDKQIQTSLTELEDKVPQTSPKIKESHSETMSRFPLSNNLRQTEIQNTNPFSLENLLNRAKAKHEYQVRKAQLLNQKNSANNQNWNNAQIDSKPHQPNNLSEKNKFTYPYSKKAEEVTTPLPLANSSIPVLAANKLIDNSLTPVSETIISNSEATDPAKSAAKKECKRPLIVIGRKKNEMPQESSLPVNASDHPNKETPQRNSNSQATVTTKVSETIVASNQSDRVSYNQQGKAKSSLERTMAFAREFFKNDPTVKKKLVQQASHPNLLEDEEEGQNYRIIPLAKRELTPEFESRRKFVAPKNISFH